MLDLKPGVHLLLERAVALEQMDDIALAVAKHLDLDMARAEDVFLDQHPIVAEGRRRLSLARYERIGKMLRSIDLAHAFAAERHIG